MIELSRINGSVFYLNPDLLERIESHPDTLIVLINGETYVVSDSTDEIIDRIVRYRASVTAAALISDRAASHLSLVPSDDLDDTGRH